MLSIDINYIYSEYTRIYLQAWRRQNACVFPGSLTAAGDPQSITNRAKKTYNENLIHYRAAQIDLQLLGSKSPHALCR